MPLVTSTEMFKKAYNGGYAIGAFNVNNMEIIQGITEAAKEENAPLILQVSAGARKYANHTYLMKLIEAAEIETQLPICVHLDHGDTFELCKSCIDGGFTSVMIDGSHHSFEDNIKLTRQVVEYAHDHGVVVQCQNERSQIQNRETAMRMLRGKLLEIKERERMEHMADIKGEMKKIEWGSQIRSYVFQPYTMVKDHRTGEETGNIQAVMDGDIESFINAYLMKC